MGHDAGIHWMDNEDILDEGYWLTTAGHLSQSSHSMHSWRIDDPLVFPINNDECRKCLLIVALKMYLTVRSCDRKGCTGHNTMQTLPPLRVIEYWSVIVLRSASLPFISPWNCTHCGWIILKPLLQIKFHQHINKLPSAGRIPTLVNDLFHQMYRPQYSSHLPRTSGCVRRTLYKSQTSCSYSYSRESDEAVTLIYHRRYELRKGATRSLD